MTDPNVAISGRVSCPGVFPKIPHGTRQALRSISLPAYHPRRLRFQTQKCEFPSILPRERSLIECSLLLRTAGISSWGDDPDSPDVIIQSPADYWTPQQFHKYDIESYLASTTAKMYWIGTSPLLFPDGSNPV